MKKKGAVIGVFSADAVLIIVSICLYLRLDRTAPVISFAKSSIVYTEGMDTSALLEGVTATDDRDGDVSSTLLIEKISETAKGDVLVTYVALDRSDNVAKAAQIFPAKMNADGQDTSRTEETDDNNPSETETETQTEPEEEGNPGQDGREDGRENQDPNDRVEEPAENGDQDGQARQDEGQENNDGNGQDEAGADGNPAEEGRENEAPVLRLSRDVLTVEAGAESVNWNDCIRSLSDDKDNRALLFSNLVMEGTVNLQAPGEYPVTIYTRDSEGAESERRSVTVKVEE